ncbi:MAG: RsmB/NOP family class I SAM-dependent RNA methyltransferase [Acetobacteraceae bacterium]
MTPPATLAAAIDLWAAIDADPRPADAVANAFFRARRYIGGTDRRAIAEQVWHALRARRRLEWWLARAHAELTPRLALAASLILRHPDARPADPAALFTGARFAPAPLSAAEAAALDRLAGHTLDHPAMPPAIRYELPAFLAETLAARFGDALGREAAAWLEPAPLDLRVNTLRADRAGVTAALAEAGIEAAPTPLSPWGLRVAGRRNVTATAPFRDGRVEIQDEGSQLVALLTDARPGMTVADYCAGAGGKTLALAMTMQNKGRLTACDVHAARLEGAIRRLRRAGVHNAEPHLLAAGDKWAKRRGGGFDRVLVDAPCTGTGTWRRNPDARRRLTAEDLSALIVKQAAILDQAAPLLRPGGRLVYATCSVLEQENEAQVEAFLTRHAEYRLLPLAEAWPGAAAPGAGPFLALSPARHGTDGFFGAVLVRA